MHLSRIIFSSRFKISLWNYLQVTCSPLPLYFARLLTSLPVAVARFSPVLQEVDSIMCSLSPLTPLVRWYECTPFNEVFFPPAVLPNGTSRPLVLAPNLYTFGSYPCKSSCSQDVKCPACAHLSANSDTPPKPTPLLPAPRILSPSLEPKIIDVALPILNFFIYLFHIKLCPRVERSAISLSRVADATESFPVRVAAFSSPEVHLLFSSF